MSTVEKGERPHEAMRTVQPGERVQLVLEGMGRLGEAMAKLGEKPVFVFGGIPGEEVVAEVIRERRHYIAAEVVEVVTGSPHRVEAPCQFFGRCTGCQWQHIDYDHQLELKRTTVEDALQRVGGFTDITVSPTLASDQHGYRNHARFTVGPRGRLGFVHRERRGFVDIERCMLMDEWINNTLSQLQGHCGETTQLSVRYGTNNGSWLIQPTLKTPDLTLESGQKHYQEVLEGVPFRVAASSFFQVNAQQAERMVRLVRQSLRLSGHETVVDAYAGVGTFAALLAPYSAKVIAIEESASAVKDAHENLAHYPNVMIQIGKTEAVLAELDEDVDAMVLDPPRVGCQKEALESLIRLAPTRIAYVSCDPATLARDLKVLATGPYQIEAIQPIDMFPQTHHVECVATLSLKSGHPITLASASPRRQRILKNAGIPFIHITPQIDEQVPQEEPGPRVETLALAKAQRVASAIDRGLVIGADTEVVDGTNILGKPRDKAHATEMLQQLRGRKHQVFTGVAVVDASSGESVTGVEVSHVTMRLYTDDEVQDFVESGEAMDKAGAYAVQDPSFQPAFSVEGCYLNVVGLPLCLAAGLLRQMGGALDSVVTPPECSNCRLIEESQ